MRQRDSFFTEGVLSNSNVSSHDLDGSLVPFIYREEPMTSLVSRLALPAAGLISMGVALSLWCTRIARRWRM